MLRTIGRQGRYSVRGWAILAHDLVRNELFIYITDDQQDGHVIQSTPILPMDVYEHAYYINYGTNRSEYITASFEKLGLVRRGHTVPMSVTDQSTSSHPFLSAAADHCP
ncbi:Fe-Mn family superoxide dismutase [Alicyclobacillus kakegawensis]|uniref:Fe-Mn family superoxide dismutase n=1 Tax=Alicyclobacillus kakegawensis TaxID=392012 RepID=UPI00082DA03D